MIDVNYLASCRPLKESLTEILIEDPEYAEHLLSVVKADGDAEEIAYFQALYDEAKSRSYGIVRELAMA